MSDDTVAFEDIISIEQSESCESKKSGQTDNKNSLSRFFLFKI